MFILLLRLLISMISEIGYYLIKKIFLMVCNLTTWVAQLLSLWARDMGVPGSIPVRTNLRSEFF